jgi:hypothetical protein
MRHRNKQKPEITPISGRLTGVVILSGGGGSMSAPELLIFRLFDIFIGLFLFHGFGRFFFIRFLDVNALAHDVSPVRIRDRDDRWLIIARPGFRGIFFARDKGGHLKEKRTGTPLFPASLFLSRTPASSGTDYLYAVTPMSSATFTTLEKPATLSRCATWSTKLAPRFTTCGLPV